MSLEVGTDAAEAWRIIRGNGFNLKTSVIPPMLAALSSGAVTLEYIIFTVYRGLSNHRTQLESLKTTQGLNAYVQDIRATPAYDAVTSITSVTAALQLCLDWIDANASGFTLTGDSASNALASGSVLTNRFSAAQTAQLRTRMQAVLDAISNA